MSMDRAVSWAVRSQPSVQWTSTDDLCLSITSATFTAPPSTACVAMVSVCKGQGRDVRHLKTMLIF